MAYIDRRKGRKKQYRVNWIDRSTKRKRNKSFALRKQAQAFLETLGSQDNIISHSDQNATVQDALERWYTLCTTTGRDGRPPVEKSTYTKYAHHKGVIIGLIGQKSCANSASAIVMASETSCWGFIHAHTQRNF